MTRLLNIALAISTVLFLSACGDDEATSADPTLDGDWKVTSLYTETESTVDFLGVPLTTGGIIEGSNFDYTMTFDDGAYTASGSYDVEVTSTLNGQPFFTEEGSIDVGSSSTTYTIDGNTITFDSEAFEVDLGDDIDPNIVKDDQAFTFTFDGADKVTLNLDQTLEVEDPDTGQKIEVTIDMELTLERQ